MTFTPSVSPGEGVSSDGGPARTVGGGFLRVVEAIYFEFPTEGPEGPPPPVPLLAPPVIMSITLSLT